MARGYLWLLVCGMGGWVWGAWGDEAAFERLVLVALKEHVAAAGTADSREFIEQVCQRSGLEEGVVRDRLAEMVRQWAAWQREDAGQAAGMRQVQMVLTGVSAKNVERFHKALAKAAGKVLKSKGRYGFRLVIDQAADKGHMAPFKATDALGHVIDMALGTAQPLPPIDILPDPLDVLVEGRNALHAPHMTGLFRHPYFGKDVNPDRVKSRIMNLHYSLLPAIVEQLNASAAIGRATQRPDEEAPSYRLIFEIDDFSIGGVRRDNDYLAVPVVTLNFRIEPTHYPIEILTAQHVVRCDELAKPFDDETEPRLSALADAVAVETRTFIEEVLAGR